MWRVYRAIEGIFNIKSKRHCNRRNNVILSANNELHDIVGVWMADILLYGISFCKKRCKAVVEELKKELKSFEFLFEFFE